ncbi:ATP-binding cassette domain-containing protein [Kineosporia babensis]|uniref:ATP-binding cassette domain-containing protein n=1 Tax=Kineosporia babensis TaxID=499548 RepID=A0A9X1SUX2_9ACTN|nr:ATP-binding cassette domain-containing protein [Kineosporia babensis]MCD5313392.1 ATP-binding cassette domain-containing protein [Kineosporia babensis]
MPSHSPAITAQGLTKRYGDHTVLNDLDLEVDAGSIYALLGPNGAGKTTTVRILATLTTPDSGRATVNGLDVAHQRKHLRRTISLTGQYAALDELQTGRENLGMIGALAGLNRAQARFRSGQLLDQLDLAKAADRQVVTYSGGMRRRLDLAAGLLRRPAVMFLDEPTTGLDPRSREQLWQVISEVAASGTTVLLTTQYLEEADRLADRVAIMDQGRKVVEGTPSELKQQVGGELLRLELADRDAFDLVRARAGKNAMGDASALVLKIPVTGAAPEIRSQMDVLDPDRTLIRHFALHRPDLDDVFFTFTGQPAKTAKELSHV